MDGAKIKVPTLCSTLVSLQPVSLTGGEQTLYAITADGKVVFITTLAGRGVILRCLRQVYATGYGAAGRLGVGSNDSIALPTLLESIRHVHITKVRVSFACSYCVFAYICLSRDPLV